MAKFHSTVQRRRAEGKCLSCENAPENGHSYCAVHLAEARQYGKAKRKRRLAQGICPDCGKLPLAPNRTRCAKCIAKAKAARNELRLRGLCTTCKKNKVKPGYYLCELCRKKNSELRRRHGTILFAAKKCRICKKKHRTQWYHCPECLEKRRRTHKKLLARGECPGCRQPSGKNTVYCKECLGVYAAKNRERLRNQKLEAFEQYGGCRCACCGETNEVFLNIDHIDGGGAKHRRQGIFGGNHLVRYLKRNNWPKGYQVLCFNCNYGKYRFGVCPHEKPRGDTGTAAGGDRRQHD